LPIVWGVAEFWQSRVQRVESSDGYYYFVVNGVMPPDESAGVVNNSIYTNVVCSLALHFAVEVGKLTCKSIN
jgi:trehalose/maltose hydrolase-like predicted phosphorylase